MKSAILITHDKESIANESAALAKAADFNVVYTIKKKFLKHQIQPSEQIEIVKSEFEFDDMMESYETPFPCNEFWDKKAWYWLEKNIQKFEGEILLWNLGGNW